MATVKVSDNYSKAKGGQPPVGRFTPHAEMQRNPTVRRHFGGETGAVAKMKAPSRLNKPKPRHHVASTATKTALKVTPQGRVASTAGKAASSRKAVGLKSRLPSSDKRTASFIGKATDHSPQLLAEFLGGVVIIGVSTFTRTATEKYNDVITTAIAKFTALTVVFFILYLMSAGSRRASQAAMWFGLLIDLGLLFDAANHNMFQDLSGMVTGTGLASTTKLLSADPPTEFFETAGIQDVKVQGGTAQQPAAASQSQSSATQKPSASTPKPIGGRGSTGSGTTQDSGGTVLL